MRKYAYLKEPLKRDYGSVYKVMLYADEDGVYLFEYSSLVAQLCSSDRFYESIDNLYEDWNGRIDDRGWIGIDDPLPDCQHDAFISVRVKGRDAGKPEWGSFEMLKDGKWVEYKPE